MSRVRRWSSMIFRWVALAVIGVNCAPSYGEPGLPWRGFDETSMTPSPPRRVVVLIVDDRPTASAAELRSGIRAAMRQLGADAVQTAAGTAPDWAAWHPIDVRFAIVGGSNAALAAAISPAQDARLSWTTNQATPASAETVAAAVDEHVAALVPLEGAPFQPLARALSIVNLLTRPRPDAEGPEQVLHDALSSSAQWIGVAIVAASDDESPGPTSSFRLPKEIASIGLATSRRDAMGNVDPLVYPRLIDWSEGMLGAPFAGCTDDSAIPYRLFPPPLHCGGGGWLGCPRYSIAESSPGVGRCIIEITTPEPVMCDPNRGWLDPLASNGSRRPRNTKKGERICEVMPVPAADLDACIHDATCAGCGGGWCLSKVVPPAISCPDRGPAAIRWVGGALPAPGTVHITCLERDDPAGP